MANKFPHLENNADNVPGVDNIEVYKYNSGYDYGNYNANQMSITCCNVPWDLGEVHVGNRVVSGIGNVVYFETAEKRDAWFDAIPAEDKYTWATKYRSFHDTEEIVIPLPFDEACRYNYLYVTYEVTPTADNPLDYEGTGGWRKWFYVIRECFAESPNATRCLCMRDIWQTAIYDVDIPYMMLERGHAPVAVTDVATYLSNPVSNNDYLLCGDVSYGSISKRSGGIGILLNKSSNVSVVFLTSCAEDTDDWADRVPSSTSWTPAGTVANVSRFAISGSDYEDFMANVQGTYPWFCQAVLCVYVIPTVYLNLGDTFTFCDTTCYHLSKEIYTTAGTFTFSKSDFGYDSKYADLAKLYTSPYAQLEINTENGTVARVNIQDCAGTLGVITQLNNIANGVQIVGQLNGIGSSDTSTVNFYNLSSHTFTTSGRWYNSLLAWDVPVYAVTLSPRRENSFSTEYQRAQMKVEGLTQQSMTQRSADASYNCSVKNAETSQTNSTQVVGTNQLVLSNNKVGQTENNAAITELSGKLVDAANDVVTDSTSAQNDYNIATTAISNKAAQASAAIGAATSMVSGTVSGAMSGFSSGGGQGAVLGALGGAVTSGINAYGSMQSTNISCDAATASTMEGIGLTTSQAYIAITNNTVENVAQVAANLRKLTNQQDIELKNMNNQNVCLTNTTDNSANAIISNALISQTAAYNNADEAYDVVTSAISNLTAQNKLRAPFRYGDVSGSGQETARPMGVWFNVVTQPDDCIAMAGCEMLRYGYYVNTFWEFETFNVMPKFSYWKCKDLWMGAPGLPDAYVDTLRMLLLGGVTVWSAPEYIGKTSIYDNVEDEDDV